MHSSRGTAASSPAAAASPSHTNCVQCNRLRDELALLRLRASQQQQAGTTAGGRGCACGSASAGEAPVPPLLYQLQKGTPKRPPAESAPPRIVPSAAGVPPFKPKAAAAAPAATAKKPAAAAAAPAKAAPAPTHRASTVASTQTVLSDLDPACVAEGASGCERCPCCAVTRHTLVGVLASRNEARAALDAATAAQRRHDADVVTWQQKLKAMRAQLAAAQAQLQLKPAAAPTAAAELSHARADALEQARAYRLLQQHHQDALRQIALLQAQLQSQQQQQQQQQPAGTAGHSALAGLTELQRQQMALRAGTQQTLQRLQQLFPEQNIG